jgi:hypothetical protein
MIPVRFVLWTPIMALVWLTMSICTPAFADETIELGWTPDTDPDVVGYVVGYGTTSGQYTDHVAVGLGAVATVTNLQAGSTYYFEVTAYNAEGLASPPSQEISYTVPSQNVLVLSLSPIGGGLFTLSFPTLASQWYEVQASTDLQTWNTIWVTAVATSNASVQFIDPDAASLASRFYRVIAHVTGD